MALDQDAADAWRDLVRSEGGPSPCAGLAERMREQRLTFGGRLLCPFLRPFFLTRDDERRVVAAAETMWALGERVAAAAMERADLFDELGLSEAEIRLVRDRSRVRDGQHRRSRRRLSAARFSPVRRIQRGISGGRRIQPATGGGVREASQ